MGGFSIWHWLIVLVVVLVVFGTKRLTSGARDLGKAVNEFKKGVRDGEQEPPARIGGAQDEAQAQQRERERDDVVR